MEDWCRGGITADAIGWLKSGADGRWWIRERVSALRSTHEEHTSTPRSTQVRGPREEVKPYSCLSLSLYRGITRTKLLLELYDPSNGDEHKEEDEAIGGNESQGIVPHAGGGEALFIG